MVEKLFNFISKYRNRLFISFGDEISFLYEVKKFRDFVEIVDKNINSDYEVNDKIMEVFSKIE